MLNRKVNIKDWNSNRNKVKGTNKEARILNNYLDQVSSEIHQSKNELKSQDKLITA